LTSSSPRTFDSSIAPLQDAVPLVHALIFTVRASAQGRDHSEQVKWAVQSCLTTPSAGPREKMTCLSLSRLPTKQHQEIRTRRNEPVYTITDTTPFYASGTCVRTPRQQKQLTSCTEHKNTSEQAHPAHAQTLKNKMQPSPLSTKSTSRPLVVYNGFLVDRLGTHKYTSEGDLQSRKCYQQRGLQGSHHNYQRRQQRTRLSDAPAPRFRPQKRIHGPDKWVRERGKESRPHN